MHGFPLRRPLNLGSALSLVVTSVPVFVIASAGQAGVSQQTGEAGSTEVAAPHSVPDQEEDLLFSEDFESYRLGSVPTGQTQAATGSWYGTDCRVEEYAHRLGPVGTKTLEIAQNPGRVQAYAGAGRAVSHEFNRAAVRPCRIGAHERRMGPAFTDLMGGFSR